MQRKPTVLLFALGIFFVSLAGKSQEYRITNYGISEGITYPFVYTISQDDRGFVWIGTGMGLCRFDGFKFTTDMVPDTLSGQVVGASFKDSSGALWFGYQSGNIVRYNGKSFELISAGAEINSSITGFAELTDGIILIATLNSGMYAYNSATGKGTQVNGLEAGMYTALRTRGNAMLLGSQEGLSLYSIDNAGKTASLKVKVTELEFVKIQDIQSSLETNAYWIATEDQGIFRLALNGEKYAVTKAGVKFNLGNENVQAVYEAPNRQLWVSTLRNGVYRLDQPDGKGDFGMVTAFNKGNGLRSNAVKRVFEDQEGNIWIATYGDGISLLSGQPMAFTKMETAGLDNDILAIAVTDDNQYYVGGQGGLFRFTPGKDKSPVKVQGVPADKVTALHLGSQGLFIGTETNGLFLMNMKTNSVRNIPYEAYSMGKWISGIVSDDRYVYLGTKDGVYRLGNDFKEEAHFTTNDGLPHNNIEHVLLDSKGRLLFATRSKGIYELTREGTANLLYPVDRADVEFKSLAEDINGNIWAATNGDGVICFKKDSVFQITVASGLKSDFCYSLISARENGIWVGHRLGMSRINTLNMHASVYDQNLGITGDCNLNAVSRNKAGVIFFGTTEGLISYDPAKDSGKKLPPFTNIVNLLISDRPFDFSRDIDIVLPYKPYKLRIEFIGLNYSDPQSVRYQYKLEGHDLDWSDVTSQTYVTYPRIEDGNYTFYLRSFNNEGLTQDVPVTLKIHIKPPVWKTWWFILLSILFAAFAVYAIIKFREKKQKQLQEYLERELAARTKEVVEQKEVIEIKNRDITDSINYAKRIQTSMLPPIRRLQQHFTGSFVFYHPRDIVSGDFYWFDQINDNKFTIVCADSTGHGVPGAFMSMIGSTLLKDICTREANNAPSKVLQVLDCELRNTLNQNLEDGTKPGDGMDIIVCEIDLKTHYVRYASAMRPMIIYRNGEEVFVKGSRNSVGGHYDKEDNVFEDEGLQLSKGDIIYMFSDGYSDQFGGPMGKKFKMVRLKNLLQDIHAKPMDEQCVHVKNTFHLWKENYEQVDDVLFMGIKI